MQSFWKTYFKGDTSLWIVYAAIVVCSIIVMFSASSQSVLRSGSIVGPIWRHTMFLLGGMAIAYVIHRTSFKWIYALTPIGYFGSLGLLLWTLFFGQSENDSTRWVSFFGIQLQSSEVAKMFTILFLAQVLAIYSSKGRNVEDGWRWYLAIFAAPAVLIISENLSTAALLFFICFTMVVVAGFSLKLLIKPFLICVALFAMTCTAMEMNYRSEQSLTTEEVKAKPLYVITHRYATWRSRVLAAGLEPSEDLKIVDSNRQMIRCKVALANSRMTGVGPGNSVESELLPLAFMDFIFAIIIEEYGLFGFLVVIILYMCLFYRVGALLKNYELSAVHSFTLIGLTCWIVFQAFINMAVVVGVIPVTGQTLPFFSRGGTSIFILSIAYGIILCISRIAVEGSKEEHEVNNTPAKNKKSEAEIVEVKNSKEETPEIIVC